MFEEVGNARHLLLFFIYNLDQKHCTSYSAFLYCAHLGCQSAVRAVARQRKSLKLAVWEDKGKGQTANFVIS